MSEFDQNSNGTFSFEPAGEPTGEPAFSYGPLPRDLKQDRRQLSTVAFATVFITLVTAVVQLLLSVLVNQFLPPEFLLEQKWFLIAFSSVPMYAVAMPLSLFVYRFARSQPPEKRRMGFPAWLGLLAVCFAVTYVGNIIGTAVNAVIGVITGEPPTNELEQLTANTPLWANLLFVGILAPILEEIFYRKLVIDRLRTFGEWPAVILSGVLFGMIHGNFGQFFYATMMGIVFGLIYIRTGRLRYTVGLHMAINLVGGVFTSEVLKYIDLDAFMTSPTAEMFAENWIPLLLLFLYFGFVGLCFVAAPIAIVLMWKQLRELKRAQTPPTAREWVKLLAANPFVWGLLVLVVLLFVL